NGRANIAGFMGALLRRDASGGDRPRRRCHPAG
ncbi:MAG: hypothetical protein ACI9ZH_002004, partial [Paracoccaceae bacterium]